MKRTPLQAAPQPRRALSVEEAAESVGVSAAHIYRLAQRGEIRAARSGRRWLIPVEALDDLLRAAEPVA